MVAETAIWLIKLKNLLNHASIRFKSVENSPNFKYKRDYNKFLSFTYFKQTLTVIKTFNMKILKYKNY